MQRRRGTTSPDPEKTPEPLRGPLGGLFVGIPREEKTLKASKGQFSSESLSEAFAPLVLHLRSSKRTVASPLAATVVTAVLRYDFCAAKTSVGMATLTMFEISVIILQYNHKVLQGAAQRGEAILLHFCGSPGPYLMR